MTNAKRDFLWAFCFCFFSVAAFFYSDTFASRMAVPRLAESALYTKIWAVAFFALSSALLTRSLKSKTSTKSAPLLTLEVVLTVGSIILYMLALPKLGFLLCTVCFLTVLITYYHLLCLEPEKRKTINFFGLFVKYLGLSLIVTWALNFSFVTLLGVSLPGFSLF